MGASLKDIACKLNLSKTTVSWVLSGQGDKKGISAETQSRVLACARSLAYEPNLLARSLNTGVSKTIGLILPSISDTFFAHIADRIESEAEREGYSLMIAGSNSETERENALIRLFRSKKVDGIIIAPADASGCEVGRLAESGCPVVLFDRCLAKTDAGCVVIDNEAGSHALVRHLAARGFRKIAIITTFPHLPTMELRHRGYLRALAEAGLHADPRGSGSLTCTVQVADTEPYVAEILAVPAATAVTRPDSETVANSSASEDHTTSSVVFAGAGVAVSCRVSPTASSFSVQSSTTAVAGTRESPSSSEQAAKAQAANAKSKSFFIVRLILSMFVK